MRSPGIHSLLGPARLGPLLLCSALAFSVLITSCRQGPTTRLQELKGQSKANWMPASPAEPAPAAGGKVDAPAPDSCLSCHEYQQPVTLPGRREFLAELDAEQQALLSPADLAGLNDKSEYLSQTAGRPAGSPAESAAPSHPGSWLAWHPPDRFGCVVCHAGNPAGSSFGSSGHAQALKLESELAETGDSRAAVAASPERRLESIRSGAAVYASCAACHPGSYVPGAQQLMRGRQLIRDLGCSACHEVSPQLQTSLPPGRLRQGPSLARVGEKLSLATLSDWPNVVHKWTPLAGAHGMPQYRLSEEQSRAIAVFLKGGRASYGEESDPLLGTPKGPGPPHFLREDDPDRGLELVRQGRCINCHSLPVGLLPLRDPLDNQTSTNIGPSLERIGERVASEWIEQFLASPAAHYPGTRMPRYRFSAQERRDIAAWLVLSSSDNGPRMLSEALPDWYKQLDAQGRSSLRVEGRRLFVEQGCAGCHQTADNSLQPRMIGPSLLAVGSRSVELLPPAALAKLEAGQHQGLLDYFQALLAEPGLYGAAGIGQGRMPLFALDAGEREAIAVALLAETGRSAEPALTLRLQPQSAMPAHQSVTRLFADPLRSDYWPWPLPPQGPGPAADIVDAGEPHAWLSLAERGLHPQDCAACHPEQYQQWQGSRHARAMSPGISGQLVEWLAGREAEFMDCLRCHARLSEQQLLRRVKETVGSPKTQTDRPLEWEANPDFQPGLQASAHGCANCHLRGQVRLGAPQPRASYRWDSGSIQRHELQREDWLRDSRLCADCHQFSAGQKLSDGGPPLENTYEEWRAWAQTQSEPQSCQDCHMPEGDHSFKGIHDADFVRRSATVRAEHAVAAGRLRATLTLVNSNNGHHLPTYVTPRIWLQGYFTDADGQRIDASFRDAMVGRDADSRKNDAGQTEWYDRSDTRIPAGESFSFIYHEAIPAAARAFRLEIFVEPDHFYYHAYGRWLNQDSRSSASKTLLKLAREQSAPAASGYYLFEREYRLP